MIGHVHYLISPLTKNCYFRQELEFYLSARFYLSIKLAVRQAVKDKEDEISFTTPKTDLLESTDIESEIYRQIEIIANKIDNFTRNG